MMSLGFSFGYITSMCSILWICGPEKLGQFTFPSAWMQKVCAGRGRVRQTYLERELVFEPLQVEVQVGLGHLLASPASQLGEDPRRHVDDEPVLAVQQVQERPPDALLAPGGVLVEDLDAGAILLQQIVNHHQDVLDGLVLGHVRQQIEERLGALPGARLQVLDAVVAVQRAHALVVLVGDHLRLHVRLPVDLVLADVTCLLLQHARRSNHVCIGTKSKHLSIHVTLSIFSFTQNCFPRRLIRLAKQKTRLFLGL